MTARTAWIVIIVSCALSGAVVWSNADPHLPGNDVGYAPTQPIDFSHRLHAGELEIDCRYCHFGAERSRHAGIPPLEVCMNCHRTVSAPMADIRAEEALAKIEEREPRTIVSPEIKKIYDALGLNDELIRDPSRDAPGVVWNKVYDLPDFAYFDHSRHVNSGVDCASCHGPVETMARVRQVGDLSMGWCVNCHRTVNDQGLEGHPPVHASTDCSGCHY